MMLILLQEIDQSLPYNYCSKSLWHQIVLNHDVNINERNGSISAK